MENPVTSQNLQPNEPELADLGALWRKMVMLGLSCHHVAKIDTFDPTQQTANATILYKKTIFKPDPTVNQDSPQSALLYSPVAVDYPPLLDCPVVCLGGGVAGLTFPIKPGDECIALFNDRDIDGWFGGSANAPNPTLRLHSLSDAVLVVGVRSLAKVIASYDTARALLFNGTTKLGAGEEKILLQGGVAGAFKLGDLLQQLCTQLQSLTSALAALTVLGVQTGAGVSGVPSNAAAISAVGSAIAAIATNLGTMLE